MDLITLILSCSFHTLNDDLIESIALVESGGNENYVRLYGEFDGVAFRTKAQAQRAIERIGRSRKDAYVGLMGVPTSVAKQYEVMPTDLLDACTNISTASAILSGFEEECMAEGDGEPVICTLNRYAMMTQQDPELFIEAALFGAISTPDENGKFPNHNEAVSGRVFWETNSTKEENNSLFFNVDVGQSGTETGVRTAKDLDEKEVPEVVK